MEYAVLVVNGSLKNFTYYKQIIEKSSLVVCSDGGANLMYSHNQEVDYIIGDLDSISKETLEYYKKKNVKILKYPVKKDKTDSELSLDIIRQKGFKKVIMIGYMGNRIDHMLTNINLLSYAYKIGLYLEIKDENNNISYIPQGVTKTKIKKDTTVSFISLVGEVKGISLNGFEYNLDDYDLGIGSSILTSNIAKENQQEISLKSGSLIMITINDIEE